MKEKKHSEQDNKLNDQVVPEKIRDIMMQIFTTTLKSPYSFIVVFILSFSFIYTKIWWLSIVSGIIGGYFSGRAKWAFLAGFLGVFSSWGVYYIVVSFQSDLVNLEILLSVIGIDVHALIFLSMALGGVLGSMGGINGYYLKVLIMDKIQIRRLDPEIAGREPDAESLRGEVHEDVQ
ncbi:MAG: hypothetical protein ACTSYS_12155 [Promethearchaeota archaeon]